MYCWNIAQVVRVVDASRAARTDGGPSYGRGAASCAPTWRSQTGTAPPGGKVSCAPFSKCQRLPRRSAGRNNKCAGVAVAPLVGVGVAVGVTPVGGVVGVTVANTVLVADAVAVGGSALAVGVATGADSPRGAEDGFSEAHHTPDGCGVTSEVIDVWLLRENVRPNCTERRQDQR